MQRLEVSGVVRPIYGSLGVKRLTSALLLSVFPANVLYAFLSFPILATCPANPIFLNLIALII